MKHLILNYFIMNGSLDGIENKEWFKCTVEDAKDIARSFDLFGDDSCNNAIDYFKSCFKVSRGSACTKFMYQKEVNILASYLNNSNYHLNEEYTLQDYLYSFYKSESLFDAKFIKEFATGLPMFKHKDNLDSPYIVFDSLYTQHNISASSRLDVVQRAIMKSVFGSSKIPLEELLEVRKLYINTPVLSNIGFYIRRLVYTSVEYDIKLVDLFRGGRLNYIDLEEQLSDTGVIYYRSDNNVLVLVGEDYLSIDAEAFKVLYAHDILRDIYFDGSNYLIKKGLTSISVYHYLFTQGMVI